MTRSGRTFRAYSLGIDPTELLKKAVQQARAYEEYSLVNPTAELDDEDLLDVAGHDDVQHDNFLHSTHSTSQVDPLDGLTGNARHKMLSKLRRQKRRRTDDGIDHSTMREAHLNQRIIQNSEFSGWAMDQESVPHSKQAYLGLPSATEKFGRLDEMVALGYEVIKYERYVLFENSTGDHQPDSKTENVRRSMIQKIESL